MREYDEVMGIVWVYLELGMNYSTVPWLLGMVLGGGVMLGSVGLTESRRDGTVSQDDDDDEMRHAG
jgi:hypothetical protein